MKMKKVTRLFAAAMAAVLCLTGMPVSGVLDTAVVASAQETDEAQEKEELIYTGTAVATETVDCTGYTDANCWDDDKKKNLIYETGMTEVTVKENALMKGTVTIDEECYQSLAASGSYLKLQTVLKVGSEWIWTQGGSFPYLDQSKFNKSGEGYTAEFEDRFTDITGGAVNEIDLVLVGVSAKGSVSISDITLHNLVSGETVLPEKEPAVVDDFEAEEEGAAAGWSKESGWQYDNDVTAGVVTAYGSKMLQLGLDYTGCEGYTWSEAKIKKNFAEGLDVSAYNVLSYELIYPVALDGKFKAKVFAKQAQSGDTPEVTILDKEGVVQTSDLGDGNKKAVVTVKFSPNAAKLTDLTLGIVGVSTGFVGNVYLDNVKLSQYNAAADFVDITTTPGEGSEADITGMPAEVSLADTGASAAARALYAYLKNLDAKDQVLFGHQNDTHKCVSTADGVYSDVKDVTGSISGLVGIDSLALTGTELGITDTDEAIAKAIEIGKAAASEGAILTLSTHMPNMSNSKIVATPESTRPYDFSACDFSESKDLSNNCAAEVLPGGKYNAQFLAYLDIIADYANGLGDIPVLFRPFHENDGGWFWWGSATTDKETYKAMYRYMEDYLTSVKNVHNFIYVYSPNGPVTSESKYLDRYPGDDYIDVIAFDYYDDYNSYPASYSDAFFTNLRTSCEIIKQIADARGKVAAISEAGVRVMKADGSDNEGLLVKENPILGQNWYKKLNTVAKETGMPYFLLWANFSDTNFYVPYKYSDTKGQELINEFIGFYNEKSSIFANGTNFYGADGASAAEVSNTNAGTVSGYFTNLFAKAVIQKETILKANVRNARSVKFILKNTDQNVTKEITAVKAEDGSYEGTVTEAMLGELGRTDVGTVTLEADGTSLVTLPYISFGKEKDTLPKNTIENFELYYGDNDYLNGTFTENSAAGCGSSFRLDETNKAEGSFGGAFTYSLSTDGPEVWTGRMKGLAENNYSDKNALSLWVKPDGKGQKLVIQLVSNGEDFEAYLTDFVKTTEAKYVTIPFDRLKGKNGGTFDAGNITKFAVWCNSIPAEGETAVDVTSAIVFDDIRLVKVDTGALQTEAGGYALTDKAVPVVEDEKPVEKQEQSALLVTGAPAVPRYGSSFSLAVTGGSGTGAVSYAVTAGSGVAKVDAAGKVTITGVGKAAVTVTKAADDTYKAAQKTITFTSVKADQKELVLTGIVQNGTLAGNRTLTLKAAGGSGTGAVSWKVTGGSRYAKIDSRTGKVTVTGLGRVTVTATKAADSNYLAKTAAVSFTTKPAAKNAKVAVGSLKYQVTKSAAKGGTVTCYAPKSAKITRAVIPSAVKIGGVAFRVTAVSKHAFKGCKKLKTVKMANTVASVGDSAFSKCTSLTTVTMGTGVKTIGKKAFYGDKKLKTIVLKSKKLKKAGSGAFQGIYKKAVIQVPASKVKAYTRLMKGKGQSKTVKIKK